ncbi:FkbM family methyltransferase [Agrobacterium larrymoorei]|uniref:FkbM family methyltransferase n=1 Tax=Agrobacterium larrymoorei TaxID=160699 RepID=A0ABU0UDT9_9HYPH|nr:FkbM family methyltransferase [Agrobacterium larrymoorei]MDQ1183102.1 FkbM family methyltransferase [Agrobacterium larrymoorei]
MTVAGRLSSSLGLIRSLIVYYGQPWRRLGLKRFYRSLVSPGQLVFDIGAHVGSRSRTLIEIGARVVAIEPQPLFADFIEKHLGKELEGFERVAVGASQESVDLLISSRHPTVTSVSSSFVEAVKQNAGFSHVEWDKKVTVPMLRLDDLIEKYGVPAFVKIDVEGAEASVLSGLSQPIDLIAFEYIPAMPSVAHEAIAKLVSIGDYRFSRVEGETHRFVSQGWKTGSQMLMELAAMPADAKSGDVYARIDRR